MSNCGERDRESDPRAHRHLLAFPKVSASSRGTEGPVSRHAPINPDAGYGTNERIARHQEDVCEFRFLSRITDSASSSSYREKHLLAFATRVSSLNFSTLSDYSSNIHLVLNRCSASFLQVFREIIKAEFF